MIVERFLKEVHQAENKSGRMESHMIESKSCANNERLGARSFVRLFLLRISFTIFFSTK